MSPSAFQPWDRLKTCLVGRSYPPEFYSYIKNPKARAGMEKIAQETEEDFQKLADKLTELGVNVIRTNISDDWEKDHNWGYEAKYPSAMVPRDHLAVIGNKLYMPNSDYLKNVDLREMINGLHNPECKHEWLQPGAPLVAEFILDMMKPARDVNNMDPIEELRDFYYNYGSKRRDGKTYSISGLLSGLDLADMERLCLSAVTNTIGDPHRVNKEYNEFQDAEKWFKGQGGEVIYNQYVNSASIIRCGRDLYFSMNNIMNLANQDMFMEKWERLFPEFRNHPLYVPGHGDGSLTPVKPGLLISITKPKFFTETFPDWEVAHIPGAGWKQVDGFLKIRQKNRGRWWVPGEEDNDDLTEFIETWLNDWVIYVEETVFDVNMLVVDEKNVICNGYNKTVFDAFDRHGITGHVVNFRHRYFWDGGLHCITLDLDREGEMQDFFPERGDRSYIIHDPREDKKSELYNKWTSYDKQRPNFRKDQEIRQNQNQ